MDPFSLFGFVGSVVTLADLTVRAGHVANKTRIELNRQWSEYDVIQLILKEAEQTASQQGRLTAAVDASLSLCTEHAKLVEKEFLLVEAALRKSKKKKKMIALIRSYARRTERRFAFESFRDTVLLLRDLVNR